MEYENLYWALILISFPVFLIGSLVRYEIFAGSILSPLMLILYLITMFRETGPDIPNYINQYYKFVSIYSDHNIFLDSSIHDPIYSLITYCFSKIGIPFKFFLLIIGISNLLMLLRISKYFKVNYGLLLFLLMLHIFVVRDFTQMRVGWACLIVLYGYTFNNNMKYFFYFFGIGLHLTSLYLVYVLVASNCVSEKESIFSKKFICFILLSLIVAININFLSFIDPRINLYLSWDRINYGQKVISFLQPIFAIFLILISYRLIKPSKERVFFVRSFLVALITFFFYSKFAIFAHRFTNIALSLYPFAVIFALKNNKRGFEKVTYLLILCYILLTRDGTKKMVSLIGL